MGPSASHAGGPGRRRFRSLDGVLLFDKPAGISSNGALQRVRHLYGAERAGHTGTLDPFATGLLPIAFGEATKFSAGLLDADKTYLARLQLGVRTTTGDPDGEVLESGEVNVGDSVLARTLARFIGAIEQVPPMHSALKHAGRPLYEYARRGEQIDRPARRVTIHALDLLDRADSTITLRVRCSKGTYIRVLAEDIGAALGCGAHLSALRREAVGALSVAAAHDLDDLDALGPAGRDACLLPIDTLVAGLPRATIALGEDARLLMGQSVHPQTLECAPHDEGVLRAYSESGAFLGLVTVTAGGAVKPVRLVKTAPR